MTAVAAVVLAVLAGVLVWKYTDNAKSDAKNQYKYTSVLVAAKRIPANTSFASALKAGMMTREDRVNQDLPDTHLDGHSTDAQLDKQFTDLVAEHDIVQGETIVAEDFVSQGESQSGLAGQLQTDQSKDKSKELMAISVTLDDQHAVGGFLSPGDNVNAIFSGPIKDLTSSSSAGVKTTAFLLPNLKVIAVGSTTSGPSSTTSSDSSSSDSNSANARPRSLITFEVTPRQAAQLVQAQAMGTLYLTLNPPAFKAGDYKDPGEVVEAVNLFDKQLPLVQSTLQQIKAANAG